MSILNPSSSSDKFRSNINKNRDMTQKNKNTQSKMRPVDNPYETWKSPDGTWEWRVLKKWQVDDNKPYARYFCAVKSPYTHGSYDMGDVYVADIKSNAVKQEDTKNIDNSDKARNDFLKARENYQENKTPENLQIMKKSMKNYNPFSEK